MNTTPANIDQILAGFEEAWAPRIVATMNDYAVKVARLEGEYVWHAHHDTDEVFLVLSGTVDIALRTAATESSVQLQRNEVFVVPRGVEHRPAASSPAVVLLIEPLNTLSTGDFAGEVPNHITSTAGLGT